MNKTKRNILTAIFGLAFIFTATACETDGKGSAKKASENEIAETGTQMSILTEAQPSIQVPYSQVRQTLILAEYLAATGAASHSFVFNAGKPDPIFECDSIGFPVPGTFNLTNPLVEDPNTRAENGIVVAQAEGMLGVYTGDTQGTYLVCLTDEGKPYVTWNEGTVQGGYPLGTTWDSEAQRVKLPTNADVPETPVPLTQGS